MVLQGSLQEIFDALYELGVIEPLLLKDWMPMLERREVEPQRIRKALAVLQKHQGPGLVRALKKLDSEVLEELALEVAKEYAEFYGRTETH